MASHSKAFSITVFVPLFVLCFLYCFPAIETSPEETSSINEEIQCGRVINDQSQARECLQWKTNTSAPLPVDLKTTITENFICKKKLPVYTFHCTVHGNDLLWDFNNDTITAFLPFDPVGRTASYITYDQESEPIYNVTTILTHVSKIINTTIPTCVSVLIVQPFHEDPDDFEVIPFSVSCQTNCQQGASVTEVCKATHYRVAAVPSKLREVDGNVTHHDTTGIGDSFASVNWLPPDNEIETTIDYYDLTLNGPNITSTTVSVDAAVSLPYKFVLPEGNFTTVSVTAVDVCGQRSEPSESVLNAITGNSPTLPSTCSAARQEQLQGQVTGLAVGFVITLLLFVTVLIILIFTLVINKDKIQSYYTNKKPKLC